MTHTAGPWTVIFYNGMKKSLIRVRPVGSPSSICGVHIRHRDRNEAEANAHLIAAAPETAAELARVTKQRDELLGLCKYIETASEDSFVADDDICEFVITGEARRKLVALLARVEGEG